MSQTLSFALSNRWGFPLAPCDASKLSIEKIRLSEPGRALVTGKTTRPTGKTSTESDPGREEESRGITMEPDAYCSKKTHVRQ